MKFSLKHSLPHENFESFFFGLYLADEKRFLLTLASPFQSVRSYLFIVMNTFKELLDEKRFFKSLII